MSNQHKFVVSSKSSYSSVVLTRVEGWQEGVAGKPDMLKIAYRPLNSDVEKSFVFFFELDADGAYDWGNDLRTLRSGYLGDEFKDNDDAFAILNALIESKRCVNLKTVDGRRFFAFPQKG